MGGCVMRGSARDRREPMFTRAVAIADEAMTELLKAHARRADEHGVMWALVDAGGREVNTLAEADHPVIEAVEWLMERGLCEVVEGRNGATVVLLEAIEDGRVVTALNDFAAVDQGRFSFVVDGEVLARGVSLCLVTAAQWFECMPVGEGRFRFIEKALRCAFYEGQSAALQLLAKDMRASDKPGDECHGWGAIAADRIERFLEGGR